MNKIQKRRYDKLSNFIKRKWIPEVLMKCHAYKMSDDSVNFAPIFFTHIPLKSKVGVSNHIQAMIEFPKWHAIHENERIQMRPIQSTVDSHIALESIAKCMTSKFYSLLGDANLKDVDYSKWLQMEQLYETGKAEFLYNNSVFK